MKVMIISLLLTVLLHLSGGHKSVNTPLLLQLKQMKHNDQLMIEHPHDPAKLKIGADSVIVASDSALREIHNGMLRKIFDQYGYPDYNIADTAGAEAFWLLIQHQDADTAFQKSVLTAMKIKVGQGLASGSDYAYLTDRVLVNTGHKQIYGTQLTYDKNTKQWVPLPLQDPSHLDKLRHEADLKPMQDYLRIMKSYYIDSTGTMNHK